MADVRAVQCKLGVKGQRETDGGAVGEGTGGGNGAGRDKDGVRSVGVESN